MESTEQTELTSKIETLTESRMTGMAWGRLAGGGIKQKRKKDSWTWITVWGF